LENHSAAIQQYERALDIYTRLGFPAFVHEAHKGMVMSLIACGMNDAAEKELQQAIQYYEAHRSKIWDQESRNTFFDIENDIYDIAIAFAYTRMSSPIQAFDFAELSKARSLLDHINGSRSDPARSASGNAHPFVTPLPFEKLKTRLPA